MGVAVTVEAGVVVAVPELDTVDDGVVVEVSVEEIVANEVWVVVEDAVAACVEVERDVVVAVYAAEEEADGVTDGVTKVPLKTRLSRLTVPPDDEAKGDGASRTHKSEALLAPGPKNVVPNEVDPVEK